MDATKTNERGKEMNFIKVTDRNGSKWLVNVAHVQSIFEHGDHFGIAVAEHEMPIDVDLDQGNEIINRLIIVNA
jgi:hypothetical protein